MEAVKPPVVVSNRYDTTSFPRNARAIQVLRTIRRRAYDLLRVQQSVDLSRETPCNRRFAASLMIHRKDGPISCPRGYEHPSLRPTVMGSFQRVSNRRGKDLLSVPNSRLCAYAGNVDFTSFDFGRDSLSARWGQAHCSVRSTGLN